MTRKPIILDTDIGTDVDDLLALSLVLTSPELELVGVTTVYGDVALRADGAPAAHVARRRRHPPGDGRKQAAAGQACRLLGRPRGERAAHTRRRGCAASR